MSARLRAYLGDEEGDDPETPQILRALDQLDAAAKECTGELEMIELMADVSREFKSGGHLKSDTVDDLMLAFKGLLLRETDE